MKIFLLDVNGKTAKAMDVAGGLDCWYRLIGCDTIDIVTRKVGGRKFDIICDDCGLMSEHPIISAVDAQYEPMLVGSLVFAHHDAEGNTTGLVDGDVEAISGAVRHIRTLNDLSGHPCVVGMEY